MTLYRMDECGLAESHGAETADLLRRLLPHVTELRFETGELFGLAASALAHGADRGHVRQIAAEMIRLGRLDGEQLRQMADNPPR